MPHNDAFFAKKIKVTPNNSTTVNFDLGLYIGSDGDIAFVTDGDTLPGDAWPVVKGTFIPGHVTKVMDTGTTPGLFIVGLSRGTKNPIS